MMDYILGAMLKSELQECIDLMCFRSNAPMTLMYLENERYKMIASTDNAYRRRKSCDLFRSLKFRPDCNNKTLCKECDEACADIFRSNSENEFYSNIAHFEEKYRVQVEIDNFDMKYRCIKFQCPYLGFIRFAIPIYYGNDFLGVIFAGQFMKKDIEQKLILERLYEYLVNNTEVYRSFAEAFDVNDNDNTAKLRITRRRATTENAERSMSSAKFVEKLSERIEIIDNENGNKSSRIVVNDSEIELVKKRVLELIAFFEITLKSRIVEKLFFEKIGVYIKGDYGLAHKLEEAFAEAMNNVQREFAFDLKRITAYYSNIIPPLRDEDIGYYYASSVCNDHRVKKIEYCFEHAIDRPTNPQIATKNENAQLFEGFRYIDIDQEIFPLSENILVKYQHWVIVFTLANSNSEQYSKNRQKIEKLVPVLSNIILRIRGLHSVFLKDQYEIVLKTFRHESSHMSLAVDSNADDLGDLWDRYKEVIKEKLYSDEYSEIKKRIGLICKDVRSTSDLIINTSVLIGLLVGRITRKDIINNVGFEHRRDKIDIFRDLYFKWASAYRHELQKKGVRLAITDTETGLRRGSNNSK